MLDPNLLVILGLLLLSLENYLARLFNPGLHVETLFHAVPNELLEFSYVESRLEELGHIEYYQAAVLRTDIGRQRFARLDHAFLAECLIGF